MLDSRALATPSTAGGEAQPPSNRVNRPVGPLRPSPAVPRFVRHPPLPPPFPGLFRPAVLDRAVPTFVPLRSLPTHTHFFRCAQVASARSELRHVRFSDTLELGPAAEVFSELRDRVRRATAHRWPHAGAPCRARAVVARSRDSLRSALANPRCTTTDAGRVSARASATAEPCQRRGSARARRPGPPPLRAETDRAGAPTSCQRVDRRTTASSRALDRVVPDELRWHQTCQSVPYE